MHILLNPHKDLILNFMLFRVSMAFVLGTSDFCTTWLHTAHYILKIYR